MSREINLNYSFYFSWGSTSSLGRVGGRSLFSDLQKKKKKNILWGTHRKNKLGLVVV